LDVDDEVFGDSTEGNVGEDLDQADDCDDYGNGSTLTTSATPATVDPSSTGSATSGETNGSSRSLHKRPSVPPVVSEDFIEAYACVKVPVLKPYELYSPDGAPSKLISNCMKVLLYKPMTMFRRGQISGSQRCTNGQS
jgi:hypothetical protein